MLLMLLALDGTCELVLPVVVVVVVVEPEPELVTSMATSALQYVPLMFHAVTCMVWLPAAAETCVFSELPVETVLLLLSTP